MKSILYLVRNPPGIQANETIDMILVSGIFDQPTTVIFLGDGVYQLIGDGNKAHWKDTRKKWSAVEAYGIEDIFVHSPSLEERGLELGHLDAFVEPISSTELANRISNTECVISD